MRVLAPLVLGAIAFVATAADSPAPAPAPALARIEAQISIALVLRGSFVQEKRLQGFRNPLRSNGKFVVAGDHGVLWRTERPFASVLAIGRSGLRVDGENAMPGDSLLLGEIAAVLRAALGGDLRALSARFEIQADIDAAGHWHAALNARDAGLARLISELELQGARYVEQVSYRDGAGNHTLIAFADLVGDEALTAAEVKAFE